MIKVARHEAVNDAQKKKEWTWDRIWFCICLVLERMEAIDLSGFAKKRTSKLHVLSFLEYSLEFNLMLWLIKCFPVA